MNIWNGRNGHTVFRVLRGRSNAYVVSNGTGRLLLVDTGRKRSKDDLFESLGLLGATPETLVAVLLTHVHFDHVENAAEVQRRYGSSTIVHRDEAGYLASGDNAVVEGTVCVTRVVVRLFGGLLRRRSRYEAVEADCLVEGHYDLAALGFDACIIPTPGHTPGSLSLVVGDEVAIVGDALFGVFKGSVLPPYGADLPRMVKTWRLLLDTGASVFLPGHGSADDRELVERQYERHRGRLGV
jgi:hydroxyacylglutathione hydrolase